VDAGVYEFGHMLAVGDEYCVFRLHWVFLVLYVCEAFLRFWCGFQGNYDSRIARIHHWREMINKKER
jgi:hypothetical protein